MKRRVDTDISELLPKKKRKSSERPSYEELMVIYESQQEKIELMTTLLTKELLPRIERLTKELAAKRNLAREKIIGEFPCT